MSKEGVTPYEYNDLLIEFEMLIAAAEEYKELPCETSREQFVAFLEHARVVRNNLEFRHLGRDTFLLNIRNILSK